jgi:hypothetical protein
MKQKITRFARGMWCGPGVPSANPAKAGFDISPWRAAMPKPVEVWRKSSRLEYWEPVI